MPAVRVINLCGEEEEEVVEEVCAGNESRKRATVRKHPVMARLGAGVVAKKAKRSAVSRDEKEDATKEETTDEVWRMPVSGEEMEEVAKLASGEELWRWHPGLAANGEMLLGEEWSDTVGAPRSWRPQAFALAARLIDRNRRRGEWLKADCGCRKAVETTTNATTTNATTAKATTKKPKRKYGCCAAGVVGGGINYCEGLPVEWTPVSDEGRATGREAAALAESVARSTALVNADRVKWLRACVGPKVAKTAQTTDGLIRELRQVAARRGIFDTMPPALWRPLTAEVGRLVRLRPDAQTQLRRAKRLYAAILDGGDLATGLDAGSNFFRPSVSLRFDLARLRLRQKEEVADADTSVSAELEKNNLGRLEWPEEVLRGHQFVPGVSVFASRADFERWEAAVELRAAQDSAFEASFEAEAPSVADRRRVRRLADEGSRDKETRKTRIELTRDRAQAVRDAKDRVRSWNHFRPAVAVDDDRLNDQLTAAFRGDALSAALSAAAADDVLSGSEEEEEDSDEPWIRRLARLGHRSKPATYAVVALACLLSLPERDEKKGFDPYELDAETVLSSVALRGLSCPEAGPATIEALAPEDESLVKGLEILASRSSRKVRGASIKRLSIRLGHLKRHAQRFDLVRTALLRTEDDDFLKGPDRVELEHHLIDMHRKRKAFGLQENFLQHPGALSVVIRANERADKIPVEQFPGGNPLARRVGHHSRLVRPYFDDDAHDEDCDILMDVSVEGSALDRYARLGFWGVHCEGALLVPLARLLLSDALSAPVGFLTPWDARPRDLGSSHFAQRRRGLLSELTQRILQATDLAKLVADSYQIAAATEDPRQRERDNVVPLYMLQSLALGLGADALAGFVMAYAENGCVRAGLPDLLLLRVRKPGGDVVPPDRLLAWLPDPDAPASTKPPFDTAHIARILAADDPTDAFAILQQHKSATLDDRDDLVDEPSAPPPSSSSSGDTEPDLSRPIHPRNLHGTTFELRLVEVKSYNDRLQDHQRLWMDRLLDAGVDAAVAALPLSEAAKNIDRAKARTKRKASSQVLVDDNSLQQ